MLRACLLPFVLLLPVAAAQQAPVSDPPQQPAAETRPQQPASPPETAPQPPVSLPAVPAGSPFTLLTPVEPPSISPGALELLELEGRFQAAVATGGGRAFAAWFAPDALTLPEGRLPVYGLGAITAQATWDPKDYQLTWQPHGAQVSACGDMGFTWGHYVARTLSATPAGTAAPPTIQSGRYITIWRKLADGTWKVALDASAAEEPAAPSAAPPAQQPTEPPAADERGDGAEVPK